MELNAHSLRFDIREEIWENEDEYDFRKDQLKICFNVINQLETYIKQEQLLLTENECLREEIAVLKNERDQYIQHNQTKHTKDTLEEIEKALQDLEKGIEYFRRERHRLNGSLSYDPVVETLAYRKIADELERDIKKEIGPHNGIGYCHKYWNAKKRILKEKYGIDWKSPRDLNPGILFD